jgi:hypothetical protein
MLLALCVGGVLATATYDGAEARGRVVVKKKRSWNRAEWIRTPAIVPVTWSWGWWSSEPLYYGTPYWSLARHGHRGVYVSSRRRR